MRDGFCSVDILWAGVRACRIDKLRGGGAGL